MYVGLQCIGCGCKLLNPGHTFKIIGIIQEIMRIIVFVHLNRWTWLRKESLPGHPKALLPLLDTYSHRSAHRTRIGVCQLLKIGMTKPDIIRINSKIIDIIVI